MNSEKQRSEITPYFDTFYAVGDYFSISFQNYEGQDPVYSIVEVKKR